MSWPEADDKPLAFVGEIDLAATGDAIGQGVLPSSGFLEFFYDAEQEAWGFDPTERLKWRVLWVDDASSERAFPDELQEGARYRSLDLEGRVETTLADWESWHIERLGMDRDNALRYAEALQAWKEAHGLNDGSVHRIFGHPDPIQGDMMLECQLASGGIYVGDSKGYRSEAAARIKAGAGEWRLLLQIDSDERTKMMWGDVGRLYYWIRDADLRERAWDRVWLVLQCY